MFADEAAYQAHQDSEHHRVWMELSGGWRDLSYRSRHELRYVTPAPTKAAAVAGQTSLSDVISVVTAF